MSEKATSAGVIQGVLASRGSATLHELWEAVTEAGIQKLEEQVFADASSLASRGRIGRGQEPRTYTATAVERPSKNEGTAERPKRRTKPQQGQRTYPDAEVLAALEAELGEPVARPKDRRAYSIALDTTWDHVRIIARAESVLGRERLGQWFTYTIGPTTVVGFL
jgi:hypothetical protein